MTSSIEMIKALREATGAGPLACKKALQAHNGDLEKAAESLRDSLVAVADQKAERETNDGLVVVKTDGGSVCAVAVDCETDFVARTAAFKALVHRLADQVLTSAGFVDADKLLASTFVDEAGKTTAQVLREMVSKLGENIVLRGVARYTAAPGCRVEGYVHAGAIAGYGPAEGRIGALIELDAGNPAAAQREELGNLAHDLALQIVAASPVYLAPADVPASVVQEQRDELMAQLDRLNKPSHIQAAIVEGRMNKFFRGVCLLKQAFVKDETLSIEELIQRASWELGTPVTVKRFVRFEVGV